ncbi:hypothetical protein LTR84_002708 [Exophiala bonariae]|uniref:C2H2-type domain-containing protein n=1 Tax=Exophiala bonariae TaxID=1690606 RepID=A0AAV9NAV8_9EURO|nr:hypothetical protein LTR84_002708 [Exophiala bonariae]
MNEHVTRPISIQNVTLTIADTGVKPFTCEKCGQQFSRLDSLHRHSKRHPAQLGQYQSQPTETSSPILHQGLLDTQEKAYSLPHIDVQSSRNDAYTDPPPASDNLLVTNDTSDFLNWPGSTELLQSILSAEFVNLPSLEILPSQMMRSTESPATESNPTSPSLNLREQQSPWLGGQNAVHHLSEIINTTSTNVTSEAQSIGLTSSFLDSCLHMFFEEFVPLFPVVHAPTFVFKDWTHPLLLNAIALGSLFVGKSDYVKKGEILWRLAYTAVAASWHTLIKHRGPYDSACGVQLVLTALLGQVYANLSKNRKLQMTAQVFHSLGFYWAHETGMYDIQYDNPTVARDVHNAPENIEHEWRIWAAKETKLRALLGHYILDGQISEFSGRPTSQRHTSHSLQMSSSDAAFQAPDALQWRHAHIEPTHQHAPFIRQFSMLFSDHMHARHLGPSLSSFNASVILEGIKSLATERYPVGMKPVGVPTNADLARARSRLYSYILQSTKLSLATQQAVMMRWHAISADAVLNLGGLCRSICGQFQIEQHVFGRQTDASLDLDVWKDTSRARLALLHARGIYQILREMPLTKLRSIHVPVAIFSASLIFCTFMLAGVKSICVPSDVNWESLLLIDLEADIDYPADDLDVAARQFLRDPLVQINSNTHLLYNTNFLCGTLKNLEQPWGISETMHAFLQNILSLCS